jgi:hypothetical protein
VQAHPIVNARAAHDCSSSFSITRSVVGGS